MTIIEPTPTHGFSPACIAITVVGGVILLFVALKVGRMIAKLALGLIGLVLLGGVMWWFLFRH